MRKNVKDVKDVKDARNLENMEPSSILELFDEARKDFFRRGPLSPFSPFAARVGFAFVDHPMVAGISQEGDLYIGWGFLELAREFLARGVALEEWTKFLLAHELSHPYLDSWGRSEFLKEILQERGEVIPADRFEAIANEAQDIVINNFLTQLLPFPRHPDLSLLPESLTPPLPPENSFEENFFLLLEREKRREKPSSQGGDQRSGEGGERKGEASMGTKTPGTAVPSSDSSPEEDDGAAASGSSAPSPSPSFPSKEGEEREKGERRGERASRGGERGEENGEEGPEEAEDGFGRNGEGEEGEGGEASSPEDSSPPPPRPLGTPLTAEQVRELREKTLAQKGEGRFGKDGSLIPALRQVASRKAQRIAGQEPGSPWGKVTPTPTASFPWQALLRRHLFRARGVSRQGSGRGKRTYPHPHQGVRNRLFRERGFTPTLKPRRVLRLPKVAVILDTSGSMMEDYSQTLGEVVRIAREVGEIRLLLAHSQVYADRIMKPWGREERAGMEFESGGTDLRSALALLERDPPDVAVVVTDGETPWPISPPSFPVVIALVYKPITPPPSWARVIFVDK